MYTLVTIFFASLLGIIIMIGRKLALVGDGANLDKDYTHPFVSDLQRLKHFAVDGLHKYGHLSVVLILRFYVKFSNFLKLQYEEIKIKLADLNKKNGKNGDPVEKVEVSKFLKLVSEYKNKIREIKHKIHEEENNS